MRRLAVTTTVVSILAASLACHAEEKVFRIGMIGLDTSHVIAFTRHVNDANNNTGCKVVVGYPGGSPDVHASASRVEGFTRELKDKHGVEIVDSIEGLLKKVDGVLLESVDGRQHLQQVRPVFAARKPVFIDKPVAGDLGDAIEIFRLAKEHDVPCWSSSSLRFSPGISGMRTKLGPVIGCSAYSPCSLEPHHPDLYWYGVHGVEILFTIMGPGCKTVQRAHTKDADIVIGVWQDGRIGTFRGIRTGKRGYGAMVFGTEGVGPAGKYAGYGPLLDEIVKFFKTGSVPVTAEQTIEIFAFMTAADESKTLNGAPVSLESVIEKEKKKYGNRGEE
jgi:predicted dehydrogenase